MTVIAWDGKTLAADKRMTTSWGAHDTVTKILRGRDVAIYACTGDAPIALRMRAWWHAGAVEADFPPEAAKANEATLVVILPTGHALQYTVGPHPSPIENVPAAWGAGRDFAVAAMRCGKTAREAVGLANELCVHCGNGIDSLGLNP